MTYPEWAAALAKQRIEAELRARIMFGRAGDFARLRERTAILMARHHAPPFYWCDDCGRRVLFAFQEHGVRLCPVHMKRRAGG